MDGKTYYKLYTPYADYGKWLSNCPQNILQGHAQLLYNKNLVNFTKVPLIITKSLKDVAVLYKMGYFAIAPQSESVDLGKTEIPKLSKGFNDIVIFYDNDDAGIKYSDLMSTKFNYKKMHIPKEYGQKDISDYVKKYGIKAGNKLMNKLLTNAEIYNYV